MKKLKFKHEFVKSILDSTKRTTVRLFDDKELSKGDIVMFLNQETLEEITMARIIKVTEKPLDELVAEDFDGHYKYSGIEELVETFKIYYDEPLTPKTLAKVVRFKISKV